MRIVGPSPALRGIVRSFTIVETAAEMTTTLLHETNAVLGIRYSGSASLVRGAVGERLPDWTITGIRDSVRRIQTSANGGLIVVNLHETGASQVFAAPVCELSNSTVCLGEWAPSHGLDDLRQTLPTAHDDASRIQGIEGFLMARRRSQKPDAMVEAAVRAMRAGGGKIQIRVLAQQIGVSQERFEKRFRRDVGTSPKQYCSLLRLRFALNTYRPGRTLTDVALEAGYYDQSHFIREFRAVTGESPLKFLRRTDYW